LLLGKADAMALMYITTSGCVAVVILIAQRHTALDTTIGQTTLTRLAVKIPLANLADARIALVDARSGVQITVHVVGAVFVCITGFRDHLVWHTTDEAFG